MRGDGPALSGVGLGFRPALAGALLAEPSSVDFVEIVAEACREGRTRREAIALSEIWPVVPHGVKLSLGSAEGIDDGRARQLGALAREVRAPVVSEHVAFVRAGGREIGHLTELPMTTEAVSVVARNVTRLRRALPDVPLLLENVARAFLWREPQMDEGDFYAEIVEATGCDLLLDLGNLYANAVNAGREPEELLARFPLERVAMLHVAGGVREHGFYFDTHAHPVPEPVYALVLRALEARPGAAVLLERDAALDDPAPVLGEVARLRAIAAAARVGSAGPRARPTRRDVVAGEPLAQRQAALAARLTSPAPDDDEAVVRARGVLERKRADDAIPLLPELSARLSPGDALSLGRIREVPRRERMTAVADAMRIAAAAREVPGLERVAARDELVLRARFAGGEGEPRPRAWPFVGREQVGGGRAVWALKGFGAGAPVRLLERGARR